MIAFISLIVLVNSYLNALKTVKERAIGNFLAQEGLELVIAKRNIERIKNSGMSLLDILPPGKYCVDHNLILSPTTELCPLYIDGNGFYTHNSTPTSTIFERVISISTSSIAGQDYVIVTSTVQFYNQKIELTTILTEWF
ncbi:MAG: hypothetical protein QXG78_00670 [Candidatus Methanomethyliaceae archaeon]